MYTRFCRRHARPQLSRAFLSFAAPPTKKAGPKHMNVLATSQERAIMLGSGVAKEEEIATVAAGCFWGIELAFQRVPGVESTEVGYTGGHVDAPTYEAVCSGKTGHTEAVQIRFNPKVVTYGELLTVFWDLTDHTTLNRSGNDIGTQYRSGLYFHDLTQKKVAESSRDAEQTELASPIVTEIEPFSAFYKEQDLRHQRYLEKGGQKAKKGCTDPIRCYG